jgi:hypothetical protein
MMILMNFEPLCYSSVEDQDWGIYLIYLWVPVARITRFNTAMSFSLPE